jgi:hypothetical protein
MLSGSGRGMGRGSSPDAELPTERVDDPKKRGGGVEAGGAEALRWQLEQQANWRQAEAVGDGRQPSVDPDREDLVRIENGMRVYAARMVRGDVVQLCKRLIDGVWMNGRLTEAGPPADALQATGSQILGETRPLR